MPRPKGPSPRRTPPPSREAATYTHPSADLPLRPEVGTQAQFKKHKPPQSYRYDSSLSPALDWDGQNPAREKGEKLIAEAAAQNAEVGRQLAELKAIKTSDLPAPARAKLAEAIAALERAAGGGREALRHLKAISGPFLNWTGKAERLSFDVPTLPLFVHERLSTQAIIETLTGHKVDQNLDFMADLFGDSRRSVADQVLRAYEYREGWVNRMILGDSMVAMNSLLRYESLGGQVQMIYMDPPYGVKFGSNFQPFVRKRDVSHGDDADMTREPEMVQAYRDTWELGLHSYLTYLRDRMLIARDLLSRSGSIFVQISDDNIHHVREVMDEVFGEENFCGLITFAKTSGLASRLLPSSCDYLLWYGREKTGVKYRQLFDPKPAIDDPTERYICVETPEGEIVDLSVNQKLGKETIPEGRILKLSDITSQDPVQALRYEIEFAGQKFLPSVRRHWSTHEEGMKRLFSAGRVHAQGNNLWFKRYHSDFGFRPIGDVWSDVKANAFGDPRFYVVQTATAVIQRCILMTTDPGDLVLDPTCGSGTTAYVAEQWGRRWITCDTSRVPLALARQRLLTATFPWYDLKDESLGPASGFIYQRRQNRKGEEVGGIVPHITLKSIANNEPAAEEVLVDRPEELKSITRVTGPFVVEATIPNARGMDDAPQTPNDDSESYADFSARMLEVLRKSPILRLDGNRTVTFRNIRPPARTLSLSAEALVDKPSLTNLADDAAKQSSLERDAQPVAFVFGPENGAISTRVVEEAAREAYGKHYGHLYVIGFSIEAEARETIEHCEEVFNVPATYVQATPDLMMGDLLKNMRSSQIFSVCGLPDIKATRLPAKKGEKEEQWQVELIGLDVFDPITMEVQHRLGADVPAWLLDTDYNGRVFHVTQAFFPRTGAWENLKKALKGDYDDSVWDHLSGTISAPFTPGNQREIAVKVIDDRGNELLVVRKLKESK
jgi:adenine-specific DNA-methyltransferase